jgi:predicted nucleic acid-binding protein
MLFVDTSGWYAAFNRSERTHRTVTQALAQARSARRLLVTSDYVIDETLTLVRVRVGHRLALKVGDALWRQGGAEVVEVDASAREAAWQIFRRYKEHELSFTDCTSAAVMRQRNIEEVVTLDGHFTVLGFQRIPPA